VIGDAPLVHVLYLGDNRVQQIHQMRIESMKSGVWYCAGFSPGQRPSFEDASRRLSNGLLTSSPWTC
jgi:hypothetical protein